MINRYWTTFETLTEIERETAKNDNSECEIAFNSRLYMRVPVNAYSARKRSQLIPSRHISLFIAGFSDYYFS